MQVMWRLSRRAMAFRGVSVEEMVQGITKMAH